MTRLKIYISGPYTDSRGDGYIRQNVAVAVEAANEIFRLGHYAYVPHLSYYYTHLDNSPAFPDLDRRWVTVDMPWVDACDSILILTVIRGDHTEAKGVVTELIRAVQQGKRVFWSIAEIPKSDEGEFKPID